MVEMVLTTQAPMVLLKQHKTLFVSELPISPSVQRDLKMWFFLELLWLSKRVVLQRLITLLG